MGRGVRAVIRVLVVDDEPAICRALAVNLKARGYDVDVAADGAQALVAAAARHPDLVLLDLGLPKMSGLEVIAGLRGWSNVPIIVLSARETEPDKVAALDAGADDYVTKPFGMDELMARIRAAVRRVEPAAETSVVRCGAFTLDLSDRSAIRSDGEPARLTPTEWQIVEQFVRHAGRLVTQRHLVERIWGTPGSSDANLIRVHLTHIRRKLEPDPTRPRYFLTEAGLGYRFVNDGEWGDRPTHDSH
jgi:two-component system, OmpR family, KDP operon response regulator KdpE